MARIRNAGVREVRGVAARRHRPVRRVDATKETTDALNALLHEVSTEMRKIDKANERIEQIKEEVGPLLNTLGKESHEFEDMVAKIVKKMTQRSRVVDPMKLYNKLPEKDFFPCVKVQLEALKNILTDPEIDKIAKITEPQQVGTELKIERAKKAAGKSKK